jgi:hypothetical protein
MTFNIIKLGDLISSISIDDVKNILHTFKGISIKDEVHDVEVFLHTKAIDFERSALSTTYLIFDEETNILLGFFSLANKPLMISKKNFAKLSNNQQKRLNQSGRCVGNKYQINSFLIGQLGKNYSEDVFNAKNCLSGKELLTLAYDKVREASRIINTKYVWLECEEVPYLEKFYKSFGFTLIPNYISESGLKIMLLKIKE